MEVCHNTLRVRGATWPGAAYDKSLRYRTDACRKIFEIACTYRRCFSRPAHQVCPVYWEVPMSTTKLERILRFRMGSRAHLLPIEQGRHLRLPRHRRVCRLCHTGALGDERHMLLECPAFADLRDEYSPLVAECSGVMARLVWARNQPMVSRDIIACLDRMSC